MFGTILRRFSEVSLPPKVVILTFDDGPVCDGLTEELLDLLDELKVTAAFCLVGAKIKGVEKLVRRIHRDGHLIVNHGYQHKIPNLMSDDEWYDDLEQCDAAIGTALEIDDWRSAWYRPPGGGWNRRVARLMLDHRRSLMPITFFAWDTLRFPYRSRLILAKMKRNLRKDRGGIYLLHEAVLPLWGGVQAAGKKDDRRWILEIVRAFVMWARNDGYLLLDPRSLPPAGLCVE